MAVLLDVNVLSRGAVSRTRKLRDAFVDNYLRAHPGAHRVSVDLAEIHESLPVFDEWDIQAKFEMWSGEGKLDARAAERWNALVGLTDQLHMASLVVVAAPMWNLSVPWHLKRWLDAVVQPRLTFETTAEGYVGLLTGRPAVILTSRGGAYGKGTPHEMLDFSLPYMRTILGFMGLGPIHEVIAEPLESEGREVGEAALRGALDCAAKLAAAL